MNSSRWRGGGTGARGEGWLNSSWWSSARWRLDEEEPVDEQSQVEAGGGRRWMNSSPWRLEEVDNGDEQYPLQSCFAVHHTPPDEQDPVSTMAGRTQGRFLRSAVRQASFPSAVPSKQVGSQ